MNRFDAILPVLAAACWFEEDPGVPGLREGGFLKMATGKPVLDFVEPAQRRRLSPLARGVFHCAERVSEGGDLRIVFASRSGEADRTLALLRDIAAGAETSPALFSMSVHNAVPGLLSIFRGNRAPGTALAAGSESLGYGLLEACAAWREEPGAPLLFLYGEDRLPEIWGPVAPVEPPHALALLLGTGGRELAMTWDPAGRGDEAPGTQVRTLLGALAGPGGSWTGPTASWSWALG